MSSAVTCGCGTRNVTELKLYCLLCACAMSKSGGTVTVHRSVNFGDVERGLEISSEKLDAI